MTYRPPTPVRSPTITALRADLDRHFGASRVFVTAYDPRTVRLGVAGVEDRQALTFVQAWFMGRRSR